MSKKESDFSQGLALSAFDDGLINLELCAANLNRTVGVFGGNLTIFTFVLAFFSPRYATGGLNGPPFQTTLTARLLAIFLFVTSGISYFEVMAFEKLSLE